MKDVEQRMLRGCRRMKDAGKIDTRKIRRHVWSFSICLVRSTRDRVMGGRCALPCWISRKNGNWQIRYGSKPIRKIRLLYILQSALALHLRGRRPRGIFNTVCFLDRNMIQQNYQKVKDKIVKMYEITRGHAKKVACSFALC